MPAWSRSRTDTTRPTCSSSTRTSAPPAAVDQYPLPCGYRGPLYLMSGPAAGVRRAARLHARSHAGQALYRKHPAGTRPATMPTAAGCARAVTRSTASTRPLRQLVPKTSAGGGDKGVPRPAELTCAPMTTVVQQGLPGTRHRGSRATCLAPALGIGADSTDHRKHLAATRRRTERKCSAERDRAAHKAEPGRYGPSAGRQ